MVIQIWESRDILLYIMNEEGLAKQIPMTRLCLHTKRVHADDLRVNYKSAHPFVYLLFQDGFDIVFNSFMEEVQDPAGEKRKSGQNPLYDWLRLLRER